MRYAILNDEVLKHNKNIKYDIKLVENSHVLLNEIDKKLNDKERYSAAFEQEEVIYYIKKLLN